MALKRDCARQVAEQMALMEGLRALNPQLQAEVRTTILPESAESAPWLRVVLIQLAPPKC